jgi:hypothetical protein
LREYGVVFQVKERVLAESDLLQISLQLLLCLHIRQGSEEGIGFDGGAVGGGAFTLSHSRSSMIEGNAECSIRFGDLEGRGGRGLEGVAEVTISR